MKVEGKPTELEFTGHTFKGEGLNTAEVKPYKTDEFTNEQYEGGFHHWFGKVHPEKRNPKIQRIQKDKIYFTYEGSEGESVIHTKLIIDMWDRHSRENKG